MDSSPKTLAGVHANLTRATEAILHASALLRPHKWETGELDAVLGQLIRAHFGVMTALVVTNGQAQSKGEGLTMDIISDDLPSQIYEKTD